MPTIGYNVPYGGLADKAEAVIKSDTVNLGFVATKLWVGNDGSADGNVVFVLEDDTAITVSFINAGTMIEGISFKRINSTSTTATNMVAFG